MASLESDSIVSKVFSYFPKKDSVVQSSACHGHMN